AAAEQCRHEDEARQPLDVELSHEPSNLSRNCPFRRTAAKRPIGSGAGRRWEGKSRYRASERASLVSGALLAKGSYRAKSCGERDPVGPGARHGRVSAETGPFTGV